MHPADAGRGEAREASPQAKPVEAEHPAEEGVSDCAESLARHELDWLKATPKGVRYCMPTECFGYDYGHNPTISQALRAFLRRRRKEELHKQIDTGQIHRGPFSEEILQYLRDSGVL